MLLSIPFNQWINMDDRDFDKYLSNTGWTYQVYLESEEI